MKRIVRVLFLAVTLLLACGCGKPEPISLEAPTKINLTYNGSGAVMSVWDEVENAEYYEYRLNGTEKTIPAAILTTTGVKEGETFKIEVRAVATRKEEVFYSDWTVGTLEVPLMLGKIENFRYQLNGDYVDMNWDKTNGASGYQIKYREDGDPIDLTNPKRGIKDLKDGAQYSVYLRPVRTLNGDVYYGDWEIFTVDYPAFDYANMRYEEVMDLDMDRAKKWAQARGYTVEVSTENGVTYVDVSKEDKANSGFKNGLLRTLGGLASGFLEGFLQSAEDTVDEELSDYKRLTAEIFVAGGIDDYANEKVEDAESSGKVSALLSGVNAIFLDTKIHYIYHYDDVEMAPVGCEVFMLVHGNESYPANYFKNCKQTDDGFYHFGTRNTKNKYRAYVSKQTINKYDYWSILLGKAQN